MAIYKPRSVSIVGFLLLVFLTLLLFVSGLFETVRHHPVLTVIKGMVMAGLVFALWRERRLLSGLRGRAFKRDDAWKFLAVFCGTILTFAVSVYLGRGAVVASGAVGLLGAIAFRRYAVPVFCGSFVGMACPSVFVTPLCIVPAGILAGAFFVAADDVLNGFGGKLGTIAFGGCVFASLLLHSPLVSVAVPGWDTGWLIVLYSIGGAVITFTISIRLKTGPVAASALIGLIAGLLLPVLHGRAAGNTLAVMVFCASFAGMSGTARMPNEIPIVFAGIFCGLVFIYTSPYLGGAGGKLGTIAFGSVIAVRGLMDLAGRFGLGRPALNVAEEARNDEAAPVPLGNIRSAAGFQRVRACPRRPCLTGFGI